MFFGSRPLALLQNGAYSDHTSSPGLTSRFPPVHLPGRANARPGAIWGAEGAAKRERERESKGSGVRWRERDSVSEEKRLWWVCFCHSGGIQVEGKDWEGWYVWRDQDGTIQYFFHIKTKKAVTKKILPIMAYNWRSRSNTNEYSELSIKLTALALSAGPILARAVNSLYIIDQNLNAVMLGHVVGLFSRVERSKGRVCTLCKKYLCKTVVLHFFVSKCPRYLEWLFWMPSFKCLYTWICINVN